MRYNYESIGPERFQELCQALLAQQFPNLQCYPVGQPDGGRDALRLYRKSEKGKEFVVYQVKYRRSLKEIPASDWLKDTVEKERKKIIRLAERGAKQYIILTNVPGTAHADVGTIDKIQAILDSLPLDGECWWRNDIDRRLDGFPAIKWAYPEILSGQDMLTALLDAGIATDRERRTSAIRAYVTDQYEADKQVRFKQVELQNNLFDLFIDIPLLPIAKGSEDNNLGPNVSTTHDPVAGRGNFFGRRLS